METNPSSRSYKKNHKAIKITEYVVNSKDAETQNQNRYKIIHMLILVLTTGFQIDTTKTSSIKGTV